jgi:HSP20 family molecular chaperone IbpA
VGETLDIDGILNELERILLGVKNLVAEGTGITQRTRQYGIGDNLRVTSSVRVGFLDEMLSAIPRPSAELEPLIDVIQTRSGLRVLVHLPGVKKEDINVYQRNKSLVLEINSRGRLYHKEMPCDVEPSNVTKSVVENNSVVEITFAKKGRADKR